MPVPILTDEQRADALRKAARARKERAELKSSLKRGVISLADVLRDGTDDELIGRTRVEDLLASLPGLGRVRVKQVMARLGISASRRVRGLGPAQRAALQQEFGGDF